MTHDKTRFLIPIATLLLMLSPFAVDTYLPAFPNMEAEYGIGTAAMSQTLGAFMIALAISTLGWGPVVDRFGRKWTTVVSLYGFALASAGCAFAPDYHSFLWLRVAEGLFVGCGLVSGRAMIRDAYEGNTALRAMSIVMFVFAIAPAVAPLIGAVLLDLWGWESVFWFLALLGIGMGLFTQFFIAETQDPDHVQSIHPVAVVKTYSRALTHPQFLSLSFSVAFAFGGQFIYIAGASRVIYDFLGLTGHHFAVQFVPMVLGMMLGSWLSAKLSSKTSGVVIINWAFLIMGLSVVINILQAQYLPHTPFAVISPLIVYSFAMSLLMPAINLIGLDCFPQNRGMASSFQGFVFMGGNALVASLLVPLILDHLIWFAVGQMLLSLVAVLTWLWYQLDSRRLSGAQANG